jgi:hypothetical protein
LGFQKYVNGGDSNPRPFLSLVICPLFSCLYILIPIAAVYWQQRRKEVKAAKVSGLTQVVVVVVVAVAATVVVIVVVVVVVVVVVEAVAVVVAAIAGYCYC